MAKQMFNVGDKVVIKKRHYYAEDYRCNFNDDMSALTSSICTILRIEQYNTRNCGNLLPDDGLIYYLKENGYIWTSSMLDPF